MTSDPRFAGVDPNYLRCPHWEADNCHGPLVIFTLKHGEDGRQKTRWACVEHTPLEVAAFLNSWRGSPPPDLV